MPNLHLLIGLFVGLFLGILIEKYIFPRLDILFEVFLARQNEIITEHNLNMQEMSCLLLREYPELKEGGIQEQTNVIGFQYQPLDEEDECCEEDKLCSKLKNKNKNKNKNIIGFKGE